MKRDYQIWMTLQMKIYQTYWRNSTAMLTQKNSELYNTTSMKSIRSNINCWFKEKRKIDIISDACFVQSNSMFKAMQVHAKKEGRGVCKILNSSQMKI